MYFYIHVQLTISVAAPGFWLEGEDIEKKLIHEFHSSPVLASPKFRFEKDIQQKCTHHKTN